MERHLENKVGHRQVRDILSEVSWPGTVAEVLLFLETPSPGPLAALAQLQGEGGSWKESSLTAVGINLIRREKGVALECLPLAPNSKGTSLHLQANTKAKCDNAKGVLLTDFSTDGEPHDTLLSHSLVFMKSNLNLVL